MTVRSDILAAFKAALEGVTALQAVEVGKYEPVDLGEIAFPSAYVFPERDFLDESQQVIGFEVFDWTVVIEVWCKVADIETLHGSIVSAMGADNSLGGHALNCYRTDSEMFQVDPIRGIAVLQMGYKIKYRHPLGTP